MQNGLSNRAILESRIARITTIDFSGTPPESLVRVLGDYLELADEYPLAELEKAIDQSVVNARQILDGEPGFKAPWHALTIVDGPGIDQGAA